MCKWGDEEQIEIVVPAHLSHTGAAHTKTAPIDRCLVPLIRALNAAGFMTANCCCGHGRDLPWIVLHDGTSLYGSTMAIPSETVP